MDEQAETRAELDAVLARGRATWAAGDYDGLVDNHVPACVAVAEAAGVADGEAVLDIACGSGNAAIAAARRGGRVTGLDLTPELFGPARARAAAAGVELHLVAGDAEALPFPDASFDVVLSTFGIMFAPRHTVAAAELARVLKPGGRCAVASWTPGGYVGAFFRTVGGFLPPPPAVVEGPPPLWGVPGHVEGLLAPHGVQVTTAVHAVPFRYPGVAAFAGEFEAKFGPLVMARAALEPQGRWGELHEAIIALMTEWNTDPGALAIDGEYLLVTGTKAR